MRIAEELGVEHISSGDLLRAAVAEDTPLGREVAEHMAAGRLAPDEVVMQAVKPVLDTRDGYVLDGFPRTLAQTGGLEFDAVIHLDVPDEVTRERLLARGRGDDSVAVIEKRLREYARTRSRWWATTAIAACWRRSTAPGRRTRSRPSCWSASSGRDPARQPDRDHEVDHVGEPAHVASVRSSIFPSR